MNTRSPEQAIVDGIVALADERDTLRERLLALELAFDRLKRERDSARQELQDLRTRRSK